MKNLDIKTILIIVLLFLTLLFGYKWYFSGYDKTKMGELQKEYVKLKHDKDSIDSIIKDLKVKYAVLDKSDLEYQSRIKELELNISKLIDIANSSQKNLDEQRKKIIEIRKKIAEFENSPNKSEDLLIESIKNKTK